MANDKVQHIVVLMMENRSFDHMLGSLREQNSKINGLIGNESNPDTTGAMVKVQAAAGFQGQLKNDPDHHFPGVDLQIYGGAEDDGRVANMQGFVKSYFTQANSVPLSHAIMNYFKADQLPVLTTLATEFAVFNGWFSSIPGPTICNRAFAHYGTSFGQVGMDIFYLLDKIPSIYERMVNAGQTAKIYYYDQQSSTMEIVNLLKNEPQIFETFDQFLADCKTGDLPQYSFLEPCYSDHLGEDGGAILASDQHPDHDVREGERFIATVFNAIRTNATLWQNTALLIVYDEHGGLYDHVVPPACTPDGYTAQPADTGTGRPFAFDRLGIRVPAILVSPWIPRGTVVPGPESPAIARNFEHASIPATVTDQFLPNYDVANKRTVREQGAATFLDLLTGPMRPDDDCIVFNL
jgi:phospholipase C